MSTKPTTPTTTGSVTDFMEKAPPPIHRSKHPANVHVYVFGAVASNGKKMPVHFFVKGLRLVTYVLIFFN